MTESYLHLNAKDIPLFRGKLVLIISNDTEKVKKYLPNFGDRNVYAHTCYYDWKGYGSFFIVLNFDNDYRKLYHGTVTHESIHAANMIANDRGVIADFNNDEPLAYLSEWIADEVYKFADSKGFHPVIL
jgi:hypothetical protein